MVLDSLARLEDEQEGECTEYARLFPSQGTSSQDSCQDTDVGLADALANIKATSFGHAYFLAEFLGEVQWYHSAHLIFRSGGTLWSSSAHTMPYQRSLTGRARLTSLLAYATTCVMNGGGIQGALNQWNAERVDIPGTSFTLSCTSGQHFTSKGSSQLSSESVLHSCRR
ncbi:hypothetical protein ARMGADRAFT_1091208 [Armillaria gallica]|uniref:Uncharacterized protein n=1 Tax=Armillaria gallica TaxID=47427 RepID=A0A2H3CHY1_ARMGA|nr:hypothetical protein ARMGADRAFT_1091208 [Armillaria gallica]